MCVIQLVPESDNRSGGWVNRLQSLNKGYLITTDGNANGACTYIISCNTVSLRVKQGINRALKTELFDVTPCERDIIRDMKAVGILL